MKKISYFLMLLFTVGLVSCTDDDNDTLTGSETTGGLLNSITPGVIYAQGSQPTDLMNARFKGFQGRDQIEKVEVYKQFSGHDVDGNVVLSNKALLTTLTFPLEDQMETINYSFSYNDLIAGLSIYGGPMSADDDDLQIGEFWTLSFVSTLTNGEKHLNRSTTKVTVSCGSFLAGPYINPNVGGGTGGLCTITALGGGNYLCSALPRLTAGGQVIPFEFSDVCDQITINTIVLGSYLVEGNGVVNPNGSITIYYKLHSGSTPDSSVLFDYSTNPSTYTPQ